MAHVSDAAGTHHEGDGHRHDHSHSHAHLPSGGSAQKGDEALRVVAIATAGMVVVAAVELAVFAIGQSSGLLSDALHNLGDVFTTAAIWVAFLFSRRPATERFNYGFHRAEDLAGAFIALVITLSGIIAAVTAYQRLVSGARPTELGLGIVAALFGFFGNEALAQYKIRMGRRLRSAPLVADGEHSRADGLTSLAAAVGLVLTWAGWHQADPIAGLLISVAILYILVDVGRDVLSRLLDAVDPGTVERIRAEAAAVPGVEQIEDVRARWAGRRLYIALNIGARGSLPLTEAHAIAERVRQEILSHVQGAAMVDIHVDPLGLPDGVDAHAWVHESHGAEHGPTEHSQDRDTSPGQAP